MMQTVMLFIEKKLVRPLENISRQKHLSAVRDSLVSVFPLTLIGSLFLLITTLPFPENWAIQRFIAAHAATILIPYRMTVVLVTLYMVVGVGANLAGYYHYRRLSGSIVALVCFLMTQIPVQPAAMVPESFLQAAAQQGLDTSWMENLNALGWVLPQFPMSGAGVYVGAISAIIGVEVFHFCNWLYQKRKKEHTKNEIHLPQWMLQTIETILPISIIVLLMFVLRDVIGFDFQQVALSFFNVMISSVNSLPGALFFALMMACFCFFGLVGFGVSDSAASLTWVALLSANQIAGITGVAMPNIVTSPFFHFFIWIGGNGAALSLVALLCLSKSSYMRKLGWGCFLPTLLNSNTSILYGLPLILNPYFFLPMLVGSVLTTGISYAAFALNLVGRTYASVTGSLPFFLGAFFSTGDWRAVILSFLNLALMMVIYYPFFKMYEAKMMRLGQKNEGSGANKKDIKMTTVD